MGITVGMPVLKLDLQNHYGRNDKHAGNAKAILDEMLADAETGYRHCSDPDYDKDLTKDNKYYKFADDGKIYTLRDPVYAGSVFEQWTEQADKYRVVDKNGKQKKLRNDAGIGFAGIIKPHGDQMQKLSPEQQMQFLQDSIICIKYIYEKRGMTLDYAVIHVDEGVSHVHYCGHDTQYRLGKKLGLKLYDALNKTEYPAMMRKHGWQVDALQGYDVEATRSMSQEQKNAYNLECRKKRKEHGLDARQYKAEQERKNAELQTENRELQDKNNQLKVENERAQAIKRANDKLRADNQDKKAENAYLDEQIAEKRRYLETMTDEQIRQRAERIKQQQSRNATLSKQRAEQAELQLPRRSHKTSGKIPRGQEYNI